MIHIDNSLKNPQRLIRGRVAFYEGATLKTAEYYTNLVSIQIDRNGENGKFFGFGVSQKATIVIQDKNREINPQNINNVSISFNAYSVDKPITILTNLKAESCIRDENNNNITIICNDRLIDTNTLTISELVPDGNYYIDVIIYALLERLNISGFRFAGGLTTKQDLEATREMITIANLDGTERVREVLDDLAEVFQMIYFINANNELVFLPLSYSESVWDITKSDYYTLKVGDTFTISTVSHITELGDNITHTKSGITGVEQVIRDNCFYTNNPNTGLLLETYVEEVTGGLTIPEFTLSWRGNQFLEIGDKITITTKDNETIEAYVINDSITYNGGLKQETSWSYKAVEKPEANPTNLGEALKQTYARVDKVNKQITLLASEQEATKEALAQIQVNTDNITSLVESIEKSQTESINNMSADYEKLSSKISQTASDLTISFNKQIGDINSITTTTGFTFNDDGLYVYKEGSDLATVIYENGMIVMRADSPVLTANNQGVDAENLHATTYLIIGKNSRIEDMGSTRTGVFWIGG